MTNYAASI